MDPHRKAIIHGSGQSCWRTPPALVAKLQHTWPTLWDVAADPTSNMGSTPRSFFGPGSTFDEDGLAVDWKRWEADSTGALVQWVNFCNPPYSLTEIKEIKEAGGGILDYRHLYIENWARKAFTESERGCTTLGVFPYAPQTEWFRLYVMGHTQDGNGWRGHAALDFWRIPHRVGFLRPDGTPAGSAGVNTCIIIWGPNPGFKGPWVPGGKYWSYR